MLILSRRTSEKIMIGDNIWIMVTRVKGERVWLGIHAPRGMKILRHELKERDEREAGQNGVAEC